MLSNDSIKDHDQRKSTTPSLGFLHIRPASYRKPPLLIRLIPLRKNYGSPGISFSSRCTNEDSIEDCTNISPSPIHLPRRSKNGSLKPFFSTKYGTERRGRLPTSDAIEEKEENHRGEPEDAFNAENALTPMPFNPTKRLNS